MEGEVGQWGKLEFDSVSRYVRDIDDIVAPIKGRKRVEQSVVSSHKGNPMTKVTYNKPCRNIEI